MFDAEFYIWDYESESYVDYSKHLVFPIKTASLLDERLNEFEVQLERLSDEVIKTNTPCRLVLKTKPKMVSASSWQEARDFVCPLGDSGNYHIELVSQGVYEGYQYEEYDCIALNDDVSQVPRGLKDSNNKLMHTHKLHCIEDTKITEWTMCDSLTFTNSLGFSVENGTLAGTAIWSKVENNPYVIQRGDLRKEVKPYLVIGEEITIPLFDYLAKTYKYEGGNYVPVAIAQLNDEFWFIPSNWDENAFSRGVKVEVKNNNVVVASGVCSRNPYQHGGDFSTYDNLTFTCPNAQNFEIKYTFYDPGNNTEYGYITYYPAGIRNRNPLKKWTCKDVCERIFDVCEPYAYNDLAPRFSLDPSIATYLDSVIAPEFSMTRMTLREQLQMVGRYIQAEPRVSGREWDTINKRWLFVVTFDSYRNNETSHISSKMEVSAQAKMQGESYATELDTNVENLASQLDWAEGAIIEPIPTADLTLRGESIAVRLDDSENSIIATEFPIYTIVSLVCTGYGKRNNDGTITWTDFVNTAYGKAVDITQYVYERADYNNLSNYDSLEGMSKALALSYTQGQKNVRGLFFKQESIYQAYEDYAIINILQAVTDLELSIVDYALLRFQIEYLPLASARLKTSKSIRENGLVATTPYNQGANLIESKWFGQNLKGVIARIGNVDKVKTYKLGWLNDIPLVGTLFDSDYYISTITSEINPTCIFSTLGLSKDFNRLSEYVGISTNKRMWEVSERQVQERQSVLHTNAVFSYSSKTNDTIIAPLKNPLQIYLWNTRRNIIATIATYAKEQGNNAPQAISSVIAKAVACIPLGNALCFTFAMEDNYSAGQQVKHVADTQHASVNGFWGNYVPYADYYGRAYYFQIGLIVPTTGFDPLTYPIEEDLNYDYYCLITEKIKYRKDSREIPRITIELDAVADNADIIIGDAISSNSGYIRTPKTLKSVWLSRKLNKLDTTIEQSAILKETAFVYSGETSISIPFSEKTGVAENAVAWALITERQSATINVSNEDGTDTTQTIVTGGELVIGSNKLYKENGSANDAIYCAFIDTTRDKI